MKQKINLGFLLVFSLFFASKLLSAQTFEEKFNKGTEALSLKNWDTAKENLQLALKEKPFHYKTLYNLALLEFKQNNFGPALAYLRRSLHENPFSLWSIKLENEVLDKITYPVGLSDSLSFKISSFLFRWIPLSLCSVSFLICVFLLGKKGLDFLFKRKKAFELDLPSPNLPLHFFILSGISLLFLLVLCLNLYFLIYPRATLLKESFAYSAPHEESSEVFKLDSGQEVFELQKKGDWILIEQQSGLNGWIKKEILLSESRMGL